MVRKLSLSRLASVPRIGAAAVAIAAAAVFCSLELSENPSGQFPNPPQLLAKHHTLSFTLHAGVTKDGKNSFYFDGQPIAPTLRLSPGDQLKINYINDLPARPQETCAITPCMDMTNLHFHGLTVSPDAPQDDVLDMMAMPGQSLRYTVQIPQDHPPGLDWYHTHPHGESHRQALDGMSGAIVIEGMERYAPEVGQLRERVLVVRGRSIENDPKAAELLRHVAAPSNSCGGEAEPVEEIFIVNASADRYLDLQIDGQTFEIVALDGMPLAYHEPKRPTRISNHLLLAPAGRLDALVTGPPPGARVALRTLCVDTGPDGDPNPGMVLADVVQPSSGQPSSGQPSSDRPSSDLSREHA